MLDTSIDSARVDSNDATVWRNGETARLLGALQDARAAYDEGLETARELDEQFAVLIAHLESSFAEDEMRMVAIDLPQRAAHASQHRRALCDARAMLRSWLQNRDSACLARYLDRTLPSWLHRHAELWDRPSATQRGRTAVADENCVERFHAPAVNS